MTIQKAAMALTMALMLGGVGIAQQVPQYPPPPNSNQQATHDAADQAKIDHKADKAQAKADKADEKALKSKKVKKAAKAQDKANAAAEKAADQ